MVRTILIPVDASNESEQCFTWALENVCKDGDTLIIAHATEDHNLADPFLMLDPMGGLSGLVDQETAQRIESEYNLSVEKLLTKYTDLAKQKNIQSETTTKRGNAGEVACDIAKEKSVNLIVCGSRGLGAIKRAFLGSVSTYLVHHAPCPVVVHR